MNIKSLILFLVAILVGVLLGLGLIYLVKHKKNYYAVFLNNGAIYFGKLSTFPKLKLTDAIFIQIDNQGNASIQRFKDAFWMPKGEIYLNKYSVLFIAPISENSPLINFIEGKQSSIQQPSSQLQSPPTQQQLQPQPQTKTIPTSSPQQ